MNHFLQLLRKRLFYEFDRYFYPKHIALHSKYNWYLWVHAFPGNWTHDIGIELPVLIWIDSETYRIKTMKASKAYTCWWTSSVLLYIFLF